MDMKINKVESIKLYIEDVLKDLEQQWESCYELVGWGGASSLEPVNERSEIKAKEIKFAISELEFVLNYIQLLEKEDRKIAKSEGREIYNI